MTAYTAKTNHAGLALVLPLVRREVLGRYKGSALGLVWSFVLPLLMLAIYTFSFGVVLKARWAIPGREAVEHSTAEFAIILFAGLIINQFFSDVVGGASNLVVSNARYVKKVVFPTYILPMVSLGTALFHVVVSTGVLLAFSAFVFGLSFPALLFAPLCLLAMAPLALGLAWFLAALGVYFRDVGQIVPPLLMALMFLSPVLYPRGAIPEDIRRFIVLNPLTVPVEAFRDTVIFGTLPDFLALAVYTAAACTVAGLGLFFFTLTRRGFADVL